MLFGADSNIDLAQVLFDLGGVQFGSFDLPGTAGQSPIYINPRVLSSEPQMLRRVAKMLNIEIRADASRRRPRLESFAVVAGVPMGGVHIATAYAIESNTPLVFLRPTYHPDDHQDSIEGHVVPGQSAIVIDDLMTGGRSILTTAMRLERVNMRVRDAIVLIDREQGGVERLHEHGYHVTPILRLKTMLNYYYASDLIDRDTFDRCMWYLEDHHWSRQPDSELDG